MSDCTSLVYLWLVTMFWTLLARMSIWVRKWSEEIFILKTLLLRKKSFYPSLKSTSINIRYSGLWDTLGSDVVHKKSNKMKTHWSNRLKVLVVAYFKVLFRTRYKEIDVYLSNAPLMYIKKLDKFSMFVILTFAIYFNFFNKFKIK